MYVSHSLNNETVDPILKIKESIKHKGFNI